jgi:hypothetical protein
LGRAVKVGWAKLREFGPRCIVVSSLFLFPYSHFKSYFKFNFLNLIYLMKLITNAKIQEPQHEMYPFLYLIFLLVMDLIPLLEYEKRKRKPNNL